MIIGRTVIGRAVTGSWLTKSGDFAQSINLFDERNLIIGKYNE
ncbi:MAG: hypothetical protein ACE5D0_04810 [Fidelibacterota bacterium]